MKRTGIVKKTLILLLGLVVYFSVASPVETYAAELISGSYTVSVPENVIAGVNDPSKVVTLSGTWAANQNVTVTADESITMTCGSATVSTTVNFDSVTKTGSAEAVSEVISVDAPNVILGEWTGSVTYEVTVSEAYALTGITAAVKDGTKYYATHEHKTHTFDENTLDVTATYANGGSQLVTGYSVSGLPASLTAGTHTGTISYQGETATVPITVEAVELKSVSVQTAPTKKTTDLTAFDATGLVLTAAYTDGCTAAVTTGYTYDTTPIDTTATGDNRFNFNRKITVSYQEKTTDVNFTVQPAELNAYSWEQIGDISDNGKATSYFAVGDTKSITINGKVGTVSLNETLNAVILGFDHNSSKEGTNKIHFLIGEKDGKLVGLVDSHYGKSSTTVSGDYAMNISATNKGGWASSYMRTTVLGNDSTPLSPASNTLLAALPLELRNEMKSVTKYTDNEGDNGNGGTGNISATTDYLFLLSAYELNKSNSVESSYQKQYEYFADGNSKMAGRYDTPGTNIHYWLRSPYVASGYSAQFYFWHGSNNGLYVGAANYDFAVLAGFVV